jgi:hypothetical protein
MSSLSGLVVMSQKVNALEKHVRRRLELGTQEACESAFSASMMAQE